MIEHFNGLTPTEMSARMRDAADRDGLSGIWQRFVVLEAADMIDVMQIKNNRLITDLAETEALEMQPYRCSRRCCRGGVSLI